VDLTKGKGGKERKKKKWEKGWGRKKEMKESLSVLFLTKFSKQKRRKEIEKKKRREEGRGK